LKPRREKQLPTLIDFDEDRAISGFRTLEALCWPMDWDAKARTRSERVRAEKGFELLKIKRDAIVALMDQLQNDPEGFFRQYSLNLESMIAGLVLMHSTAGLPSGEVRRRIDLCDYIATLRILPKPFPVRIIWKWWSEWCAMAPLWAGVLAETRCWRTEGGFRQQQIEAAITKVVATEERRYRAFAYAKWFANENALLKVSNSEVLMIAPSSVIRLPDSISALVPDLSDAWPKD
jgi:hypothetical protein